MPPGNVPAELLEIVLSTPNAWDTKADDDKHGECLKQDFVKRLVTNHTSAPSDPEPLRNLGLLAIFSGIAQWGISDPEGLPDDPARKKWQAVTGPDSGKHLMSYSIGGVGITHADVGLLAEFISEVAEQSYVPEEQRPALLKMADRNLYYAGHKDKKAVKFDQIRAAGLCSNENFKVDLLGEPFSHFDRGCDAKCCADYNRSQLKPHDWLVFKTWMRAALRNPSMQNWLLSRWLDTNWLMTTQKVPSGDGQEEEMLVNARVRNSAPALADKAVTVHAFLQHKESNVS